MSRACPLRTAALISAVFLAGQSAARADRPEVVINGVGAADFLDPNPCDQFNTVAPFGASTFTVHARIDRRGRVDGIFTCAIRDCFVGPGPDDYGDILLVGVLTDVVHVSRRGPDRVALEGDGYFFIDGVEGVVDQFRFQVELREGGRGVGGFAYTDYVTALGEGLEYGDGRVDDGFDHEGITRGHIQIRIHD